MYAHNRHRRKNQSASKYLLLTKTCAQGSRLRHIQTSRTSMRIKRRGIFKLTDLQSSAIAAMPRLTYNRNTGEFQNHGQTLKTYSNAQGYEKANIGGTSMVLSRLAYAVLGIEIDGLVVHHINENKKDNRWKNLIAMTSSDHVAEHNNRTSQANECWHRRLKALGIMKMTDCHYTRSH